MDAVETSDGRALYICPECRCIVGNVLDVWENIADCRSVSRTWMTAKEFLDAQPPEKVKITMVQRENLVVKEG